MTESARSRLDSCAPVDLTSQVDYPMDHARFLGTTQWLLPIHPDQRSADLRRRDRRLFHPLL